MSIVQFLRIFWARRRMIAWTTLACALGAIIVCLILPQRWQASSRVMLNTFKPDPVTGQVVAGPALRQYVATQAQLITDYSVAGQVADALGWTSDANLLDAWQHRPSSDTRDFRRWVAQQMIIPNTKAELVEGSNILEITYTATTSNNAKLVADALRQAFIDQSLAFKRQAGQHDADWFAGQLIKAQADLDQATAEKIKYEKENHIAMANDRTDTESQRLAVMSAASGIGNNAAIPTPGPTQSETALSAARASLAEASKTLGPNHPEMMALKARIKLLEATSERERAAQNATLSAMRSAAGGNAAAVMRATEEQQEKVLQNGERIGKLEQLQMDEDLRRTQFQKTADKLAQAREQAATNDSGLTPLGAAIAPKEATFPNWWLIVPGALILGLVIGVLSCLIVEFFAPRVRGHEDLRYLVDAPMIGIVTAPTIPGRRSFMTGLRERLVKRFPRLGRQRRVEAA
jgi:polysaccharide biosynthesis transport protein